jgi:hypothetical protein
MNIHLWRFTACYVFSDIARGERPTERFVPSSHSWVSARSFQAFFMRWYLALSADPADCCGSSSQFSAFRRISSAVLVMAILGSSGAPFLLI